MQVVIDIPKYVYGTIIACDGYISDCDNEKVGNAIKKGTLLPKGHGRLIDADAIEYWKNDKPKEIGYHFAPKYIIDDAPTIIEADKPESEDINDGYI